MVGTLTETELLRSPFARRLGRASWFLSAWAYLIAAYCIFGSLFALWSFAGSHPSGLELLVGTLEGLTAGLVVGVIGLVISFPTLVMAPAYLILLAKLPTRWGNRTRRVAAVALAPPVIGSLTLAWWGWLTGGDYDSLLVRCLIGALLVYGLIVPLPAPRDEGVTEPVAP
jgi:hypothetical protein